MILEIQLSSFYARGDERRFFQGLKEIAAIKSVQGIGQILILTINASHLGNESMRELMALLWRYQIPLSPLRSFTSMRRFSWLNNPDGYWYQNLFLA